MIKNLQKILKIKIKTRKLFFCVVLAVLIGLIVGSQVSAHSTKYNSFDRVPPHVVYEYCQNDLTCITHLTDVYVKLLRAITKTSGWGSTIREETNKAFHLIVGNAHNMSACRE